MRIYRDGEFFAEGDDLQTIAEMAGEDVSRYSFAIEDLQADAIRAIDDKRDGLVSAGITHNGVEYQTRPQDRENIAGKAQQATLAKMSGDAITISWIAADNSTQQFTADEFLAFANAVAARKEALMFHARSLKDQALNAADQAGVDAVNIDTGWP